MNSEYIEECTLRFDLADSNIMSLSRIDVRTE